MSEQPLNLIQILQSCPSSWTIHVQYGQRLLMSHQALKSKSPDLYHFAASWFISHNVLAATAWCPKPAPLDESVLLHSLDEYYVQTLTGCSKSLLCLLSDITYLANAIQAGQAAPDELQDSRAPHEHSGVTSSSAAYKQRRDSIERQLYQSAKVKYASDESEGESRDISEVKRLAALMYFYARVDGSSPYENHMGRLTEEILQLVPRISRRTNTLLWPLFVVGTFGVRPESDDDRKLVLRTLDALQQTRQLGCVRKARHLIEDVWKARDLNPTDAAKGWSILDGRQIDISLA